jgi:very-short-patch-repair endonuclease
MANKTTHQHTPGVTRARQLRQPQTPAESRLWAHLRDRRLSGLKFRRQHPMGHYVVDFYCPDHRLVVEIDGDSHANQEEYDADRTAWLEEIGCRVIRFTNREVSSQLEAVLETIQRECDVTE